MLDVLSYIALALPGVGFLAAGIAMGIGEVRSQIRAERYAAEFLASLEDAR